MLHNFYFVVLCFALSTFGANTSIAQSIGSPREIEADTDFYNVHIMKWSETEQSSAFIIWVKNKVMPHYHEQHTEHVLILEGEGMMLLGDSLFEIRKDMLIFIPPKTIHAVYTTSSTPLKALSIQSPFFDGSDRVWAKTKQWPPRVPIKQAKSPKNTGGY